MEENRRVVVCSNCGLLHDIHYIDDVTIRKGNIMKFKCGGDCGMVEIVYKNLKHFKGDEDVT
jgi:hypothetical protein